MNTTTGAKYEIARNLDIAAIAKLIRADLKAAFGKTATFSVTVSRYSMGQSLTVKVKSASVGPIIHNVDRVIAEHANPHVYNGTPWMSAEARTFLASVSAVVDAYRTNTSCLESDYSHTNFYAHVDFSNDLISASRATVVGRLFAAESA